ncbi:MAG: UvrD-helicase domain-containing protein [Lentisphaeria bacterium]|nr:UvrD-helicase domain-containing protein [Lentisphaeria bacterium]
MKSDKILSQLNNEQRRAAGQHTGPVLVLAGAGTGKTRVITFRIASMLAEGISPETILGLTFTNKAAREMRERLAQLVDENAAQRVTLGTFHSFCIRILRKHIAKLGFQTGFTVADDSDQQGIFKQALGECGCSYDGFPAAKVYSMIGAWKNALHTPESALKNAQSSFEATAAHVYEKYRDLMEMQNLIDFDDMLLLVWRLFTEHPGVLEEYQKRYEYLLVDEYQDTNGAQFELVRMIAGKKCNLCVVGDDDQSIYSWRGADVGNILDFPQRFPGTLTVKLEQNYRSTSAILEAANTVIGTGVNRHEKRLWSSLGQGEKPKIILLDRDDQEAEFAANLIRSRKGERSDLRWKDFAVLYRSNQLSRQIEQALMSAQIPYRLVGGQQFFQRREIKDAVAYLKLLENPRDDQSVLRILAAPPRGVGPKAVKELKRRRTEEHIPMFTTLKSEEFLKSLTAKGAAETREMLTAFAAAKESFKEAGNLSGKILAFLRDVGYYNGLQKIYRDHDDSIKRRDNVDEFINAVAQFERKHGPDMTLTDYLESYSLMEENDRTQEDSPDADAVTLSTIHAAKGLEYPVVIQIAMERNIFPHERALEENGYEEELRLFYVAVTRAKEELYLTRSRSRMSRGVVRPALPSVFLDLLGKAADKVSPDELVKPADDETVRQTFEDAIRMLMNPQS